MREEVLRTINRVYHSGLTSTSGGNISCMDGEDNIFITPSGKDKGTLEPSDIVKVLPDGTRIGEYPPSMELPFHSNIYRLRKDIKAIVHAHAPAAVAYAITRAVPDSKVARCYEDELGEVVGSRYDIPGSLGLGEIIKDEFAKGYNAVMMDNHGATVGDATLDKAFMRYETLNSLCQALINAKILGGYKLPNKRIELESIDTTIDASIDSSAYADEKQNIADFCHRSYQNELFISTFGTIASRTDNGFLVNPDDVDRKLIKADDVLVYSNGAFNKQGKVKYLAYIEEIFKTHPYVNNIYISMPSAAMGFIVANKLMNSRLAPECFILLRDIGKVNYEVMATAKGLAKELSKEVPAIMVDNEAVFTIGKNMIKAFDRMEVLDYTARSIISASAIADIQPINEEQTQEIKDTFNGW